MKKAVYNTEFFKNEIQKEVSHSRYEHCLKVASLAERLALSHAYPHAEKAYLCGIVHDITKQKSRDFHIELFERNNLNYRSEEIPLPAFHAFSGALYLREKYGLDDREILSAVKSHTLGDRKMGLLEKIVYVSDFLGSHFAMSHPRYEDWVNETCRDLNYGTYLKAMHVMEELIEKRQCIHPHTLEVYNLSLKYLKTDLDTHK